MVAGAAAEGELPVLSWQRPPLCAALLVGSEPQPLLLLLQLAQQRPVDVLLPPLAVESLADQTLLSAAFAPASAYWADSTGSEQ